LQGTDTALAVSASLHTEDSQKQASSTVTTGEVNGSTETDQTSETSVANGGTSVSDGSLVNGHVNAYNNNISNMNTGNLDEVDKPTHTLVPQLLTSPSSDYWHARNPVADQVFITDVTVNLKTVTIRECKTEKGFYRNREMPNQSDIK
jgi:hypothetical protein